MDSGLDPLTWGVITGGSMQAESAPIILGRHVALAWYQLGI